MHPLAVLCCKGNHVGYLNHRRMIEGVRCGCCTPRQSFLWRGRDAGDEEEEVGKAEDEEEDGREEEEDARRADGAGMEGLRGAVGGAEAREEEEAEEKAAVEAVDVGPARLVGLAEVDELAPLARRLDGADGVDGGRGEERGRGGRVEVKDGVVLSSSTFGVAGRRPVLLRVDMVLWYFCSYSAISSFSCIFPRLNCASLTSSPDTKARAADSSGLSANTRRCPRAPLPRTALCCPSTCAKSTPSTSEVKPVKPPIAWYIVPP